MTPKTNMIRLVQTAGLYAGRRVRDRWKWAVAVDGDLSEVEHVCYTLHDSQPQAHVKVSTPRTKFTVSGMSNGWFTVKCRAFLVNGTQVELVPLKLNLHYPDHVEAVVRDS